MGLEWDHEVTSRSKLLRAGLGIYLVRCDDRDRVRVVPGLVIALMVIARALGNDGRDILILGLSKHNIGRLELGQPMRIRREVHGAGVPEDWEIIIIYGETEYAIRQDFEKHGLIGDETKIRVDPKLQREWGEA